jgi:hypothetical protein
MTTEEAVAFINSLAPQNVDILQIDKVKWEEFKAVVVAELTTPTVDPKFRTAVEQVNAIVDSALG